MLSEIRWELEWLLRMQDDDGGVWEKLTSARFGGFTLPEEDDAPGPRLIIGGRSSAPYKDSGSTGGFAAVLAAAARVYRPFDPAFAAGCLAASRRAWVWIQAHPGVGCSNPPGIRTGNYCNTSAKACRLWADAELLRATGEAAFGGDFEAAKGEAPYVRGVQDWHDVSNLAFWSYAQAPSALPDTAARVRQDTATVADRLVAAGAANGYRDSLAPADFRWGSNGQAANMALLLLVADQFAPDPARVQAALDDIHYLLGRNCFATCWVTCLGSRSVAHPHHRPSASKEYAALPPWPGLLSGGPNAGGGDPLTNAIPASVPPMRHWTDQTGAYSSNEIAINWQAPLVFAVAAFVPEGGQAQGGGKAEGR
jgi:endoglucanase